LGGVDAFVGVAGQVIHLAVPAGLKPALKLGGVLGRAGRGEAAIIKAQLLGALENGGFHFRFRAWWN
jgi:hypothetical protein